MSPPKKIPGLINNWDRPAPNPCPYHTSVGCWDSSLSQVSYMVCNTDCTNGHTMGPLFTAASNKIAMFKDPSFTGQLYTYAITTEPLLAMPGTQDADLTYPDDRINSMANTPAPSG
jgi:hypothetical protein